MRLIATIRDPAVIRRILAHLGFARPGQSPGPAPPEPSAAAHWPRRFEARQQPPCLRSHPGAETRQQAWSALSVCRCCW